MTKITFKNIFIFGLPTLGVVIAFLTFYYNFIKTPDLEFEVKNNMYEISPIYAINLKLIDSIKVKRYDDDSLDKKMKDCLSDIKNTIDDLIKYNRTKYFSIYNISNNSDKKLDDLVLDLPNVKGFYSFQNIDSLTSNYFNTNIKIGSIRPSQQISVKVWSEDYYLFSSGNEKLFHNNGAVYLKKTIQISGFYLWLYNFWPPILFVFSMVGFLFLILTKVIITTEKQTTNSSETEETEKFEKINESKDPKK